MADDLNERLRLQMEALLTPPVPPQVTAFQAKMALRKTPSKVDGKSMYDVVDEYMEATGGDALFAWQNVGVFELNSPLVTELSALPDLGLTAKKKADLFKAAAKVKV